jgi:hypothetical protein
VNPRGRDPHLTRHLVSALADNAERRWICEVVDSGFHNGAHCTPREPHAGWSCGWYWRSTIKAKAPERIPPPEPLIGTLSLTASTLDVLDDVLNYGKMCADDDESGPGLDSFKRAKLRELIAQVEDLRENLDEQGTGRR